MILNFLQKQINLLLVLLFFLSCAYMDYGLQKKVNLDPQMTDSMLEVIIRDDEVSKEGAYPTLYLFIYVDGFLVEKDMKTLKKENRLGDKYYCDFYEKVPIRHGSRIIKVVYRTFRENKFVDIVYNGRAKLRPSVSTFVSFNKKFVLLEP